MTKITQSFESVGLQLFWLGGEAVLIGSQRATHHPCGTHVAAAAEPRTIWYNRERFSIETKGLTDLRNAL